MIGAQLESIRESVLRRLFMAVAVATLASPVAAQPDSRKVTVSNHMTRSEQAEAFRLYSMQKEFAQCIYRLHPDRATSYLTSSDPTRVDFELMGVEPEDLYQRLSLPRCLGNATPFAQGQVRFRFSPQRLRPLLAEEAYLAANSSSASLPGMDVKHLPNRFFVAAKNQTGARSKAAYADCIVHVASAPADAMLRTRPGSEDEAEAARALVPALSACLVEGKDREFSPSNIRSLAADGLWSRSHYGALAVAAPNPESSR